MLNFLRWCTVMVIDVHASVIRDVAFILHTQTSDSSLPTIRSNSFILARLYLRCKKVQGSASGKKIKRNTSSAVWNTERKYNSTPHSYLHHLYQVAQLILVLLMRRLLGSFVITSLSPVVCLTLGEVGEVRGILSATTVNSLVNSWAMTGTDSDFAAAWIIGRHARPTDLYDYDFEVDKSVRGMTSQDESTRKQSVQRCTETARETAKCMKAFRSHPRLRGSSGDVG